MFRKGTASTDKYIWQELAAHKTPEIADKLMGIDDSIWYSTYYGYGESGMGEYCTKTNKISNTIKYTQNIKPVAHSLCKHQNQIYIIDGVNGQIILFNPITKQFTIKTRIPIIGYGSCCIIIHDDIHIFNGKTNKKHLIYSIKNNTINTLNDQITTENIGHRCILKYNNKIIRFGGVDYDNKQFMDTFVDSSCINTNKYNDIKWSLKPQYKVTQPMCGCGYILYKHYIITFGGCLGNRKYSDKIYILDLNTNIGWSQLSHIQCPLKSEYRAILMNNNDVHLFTGANQEPKWENSAIKHYSIHISAILGNDDDDEIKCNKCDELEMIKVERNGLQTLVDQLLNNQIETAQLMKEKNDELLNALNEKNEMKQEFEALIKEKNGLIEECKETKLELMKYKRITRIDTRNYEHWSSDELMDWILFIENGKYKQYEERLRIIFKKEGVNGANIDCIDKTDLRGWGIASFVERVNIEKHIRKLVQNKNNKNNDDDANEGNNYNATEYIM